MTEKQNLDLQKELPSGEQRKSESLLWC